MQNRILFVGTLPPPIGGVTIHTSRLLKHLASLGVNFDFVDIKRDGVAILFKKILNSKIVHLHLSNPFFIFLMVTFSRLTMTRVIVTIHGNLGRFNKAYNLFMALAIRLATLPLLLNESSYQIALSLNKKSLLLSSFIPPLDDEELDKDIALEINRLSLDLDSVVVTNAAAVSFDINGNEIYGITDLMRWVKGKNYLLVISDPSGMYSKWVEGKFPELFAKNIYFISYQHSFYSLLQYADYFIRNTLTDGDSASIHEALSSSVNVWATNKVSRPKGVHLYSNLSEIKLKKDDMYRKYVYNDVVKALTSLYSSIGNQ